MANLLTGDYGAVLQVSEATINRLLANVHQNWWEVTSNPTIPHSIGFRLGDDIAVDGVQGSAWAQIGVPRLQLIDGSTDSFHVEMGLRIRYRPDEGTPTLPTYSHGTLHATYRINDIAADCFAWERVQGQYLWLRVVEGSVSFDGEYGEDESFSLPVGIDTPTANAELTTQLGRLLANEFAPNPIQISGRYRLFKSITEPDGSVSEAPPLPGVVLDVPVGGRAVAVPFDVGGGEPSPAAINSIQHSLLAGRDFAAAVSQDVIMAAVQPALDQLRNYTSATTVYWTIGIEPFAYTDSTVYHTTVSSATAEWIPQGSSAVINLSATGHAHTESILPDLDFHVAVGLRLGFDPSSEQLWLSNEGTWITISSHVPLPGGVWDAIKSNVSTTVGQAINSALADPALAAWLAGFASYSKELTKQLQRIDIMSEAHFDDASFYLSGIVFRGLITVANPWTVDVRFEKVDGDTISALKTWIPGGRVDHFAWSWGWLGHAHDPGSIAFDDRFVLRRPMSYGRFGPLVGATPIPGLDGDGEVCLTIRGVRVNNVTGDLDPVIWDPVCRQFGYRIPRRRDGARILGRTYARERPHGEPRPPGPPEEGLREVTVADQGAATANTLVVFVHERWTDDDTRTLVDGVSRCARQDAGLLVAMAVRDGALDPASGDADLVDRVRVVGERLEAPLVVHEDVRGTWSSALLADENEGRASWRLLSPDGGLLWKEDDAIDAGGLARVLDGCLYPSPPVTPLVRDTHRLSPGVILGILDFGHHFQPGMGMADCPPFGGLRHGDIPSVVSTVSFVHRDAASSMGEVDRLRADNEGRGAREPGVLLVVDGASEDAVRDLSESLGPAFMVVGDADGALAAAAGVSTWPTTVPIGDPQRGRR